MARKRTDSTEGADLPCRECASRCCRYVAIGIDRPTCKRDVDHLRWYLLHHAVSLFIDHEGDWYVEFESVCERLRADGRCGLYERRPRICRRYGTGEARCEYFETPYRKRFTTVRALEAYLDRQGMKWRWSKP